MAEVTVGRMVRYQAHGTPVGADGTQAFPGVFRAAVITEVAEDGSTVGLCVLNPTGMFFHSLSTGGCKYFVGENPPGGTWSWPPRV